MTTKVEWITTVCGCGCGVTFRQLRDPGREREFATNACRQRAYRARHPGRNHSGTRRETASARRRREQEEAWAREEERKERDRQRKARARGAAQEPADMPGWCRANHRDDETQARRRERARLLVERAMHKATGDHERDACLGMAERMRAKYGL